ncbi:putative flavin-binding monooxygenase protein [Eutypa lata UCREL1]|uniref:Putative flavin-binding monooxygenase protein n=1 Tax=Eutypa lata (strain UCR-EL1) TaxID=1287681 RepID=M7T166_EUTLA|nr:putative flavin-binding monooxygenase protein [Eutypa lata UCREL1]
MGSVFVDIIPDEVPIAKLPDPKTAAAATEHMVNGKNGYANGLNSGYNIIEEPSRSKRKLRIICVGAGASAINFAHEVQRSDLDLDLFFKFSANYVCSYSSAPEILAYFKGVAEKNNLMSYFKLSHRVVGASWNEGDQMWHVRIQRGDDPNDVIEDKANVFINASGVLNKWKWPKITGLEMFKGPMLHSASWDDKVDLKVVGKMECFIRSPGWVTAGFGQRFAGKNGANFKYSDKQRDIFANDPKKYLAYRKKIESELNSRFRFILNGSDEQKLAREAAEKDMRNKLATRPEIADLIVPTNFAVGCRRPTPGNGFLETLCKDNVEVVPETIQEITPKGIKTADGVEHEFDVIICATGFDVSWRPQYPTIGREGKSLSEEWKDVPNTYLSVTVPHFPNYLIFNGPFGPYGHGSFLPITELLAKHFLQILDKMSSEAVSSFEPTQGAVDDFAAHRRRFLPRTAWSSPCRSWFKQGTVDGEVMMWPGSRIHFFETMRNPRWEDYRLTYTTPNRFGYFGNGFAAREFDGRDLSWYLGLLDGGDTQQTLPDEDFAEFLTQLQD